MIHAYKDRHSALPGDAYRLYDGADYRYLGVIYRSVRDRQWYSVADVTPYPTRKADVRAIEAKVRAGGVAW